MGREDFGWGSAPDPAGGAYSAPPDPLAGFKGSKGEGEEGRERERVRGGGREGEDGRGLPPPLSEILNTPLSTIICRVGLP